MKKKLSPETIQNLSSKYLNEGRNQDKWQITAIELDGKCLYAKIRMTSFYESPQDQNGFHLTIFSTLEFLSQLMIIGGHYLAGLKKKDREAWMIENQISCKRALRDPEDIQVSMEFTGIKKVRGKFYVTTKCSVYDDNDGLFETHLKAFLS